MFYMREVSGAVSPYSPGVVKVRRGIQPVAASASATEWSAAEANAHLSEHAAHDGSGSPEGTHAAAVVSAYERVAHPDSPRRRVVLASEMMSKNLVTILPSATLRAAQHIFTAKRFRHVPVVDDVGVLVGVLSDRDVLRHIARVHEAIEESMPPWGKEIVETIMAQPVLVASEDTAIREIARTMFDERIGCVPIVNQGQALVGIITRSDILRTLLIQAPLELWR